MIKKVLSGLLLLSVISSSSVFAGENDGVKIPFSTLLKNPSKVDYLYSPSTGTCDLTLDTFKRTWAEFNFEDKHYKSTSTIINYWHKLNNEVHHKEMIVKTGYDNKNLTTIQDGGGTEYLYFDSLESCQEVDTIITESNK